MKRIFCAIVLCLAAISSHAGQIYRWYDAGSVTPLPISLEIEFSDPFGATFQSPYCPMYYSCPLTGQSRFLGLHFKVLGGSGGYIDYTAPQGPDFTYDMTVIDLDLTRLPDGHLTGRISAQSWFTGFALESTGDLFHLVSYGNDGGDYGCFQSQECRDAATGFFAAVPEPSSIFLFSAGILAFCVRRRKRLA